ncbi:MAG TPA: tetratricopeptide repeat protein, partial [Thermoanaerobaculia bacterium]
MRGRGREGLAVLLAALFATLAGGAVEARQPPGRETPPALTAPAPDAEAPEAGEPASPDARRARADRAAETIRRGWVADDPVERRRLAAEAIAALETMRREDPEDRRALGDLVLAYRLAERMDDVTTLWEGPVDRAGAPHWLVGAAADAYLARGRLEQAERLYRRLAAMRPETPQPWLGLYWTAVEDRRFADARRAVERLAALPGEEWSARLRAAWLLLYEDRTADGLERFTELVAERPDDPRARQGLATALWWLGRPREALDEVATIGGRAPGPAAPAELAPAVRIVRAGALADLGALGDARREAAALASLVPENLHVRRLARDVEARLAPQARLELRHDASDRGFGEQWGHLEVDTPLAARWRLAAGAHTSRAEDER